MRGMVGRIGGKGLALVVIGAVAIGSYAIAPALGGGGRALTVKKAKRLFFTKRKTNSRFFTKRRTNALFYRRGQADARFLSASGEIRINIHPGDWETVDTAHTLSHSVSGAVLSSSASANNQDALLPIAAPAAQFGRSMRIAGLEYCYDTVSNSTLDSARFYRLSATAASPNPGSAETLFQDGTNRTDAACRTIAPQAPIPYGTEDAFAFDAQVDYSAAGSFTLTRTTLILVP